MKTHTQKKLDKMAREPWYMIGAGVVLGIFIGLWAVWNVYTTFTCENPSPFYWPPVTQCDR